MSIPGVELFVLNKMILDDTLALANKYEIEWTDRRNLSLRPQRIYIQLMFDSYGFNSLYYLRLEDSRHTFQLNGTFADIRKYYDWRQITEYDTFIHYIQRPDINTVKTKYLLK